ncbi:hypothetical protein BDN71DRAFT_1436020 [Pleurotus eryngii]|uniref:Uncharacterized protein n=1 Tax=Pleurotus eryngii TaxID=5323 RepID=A0A9P6DAG7_PLEER|nr:hypothetical protein BDN71DRAFT_1436020 [Pleurotus eryngii]
MRPTLLSVLSLPLSMVLATPVAEVTPALAPTISSGACDPVDIVTNPLIAGVLVLAGVVDPTGFNEVGIHYSSLTWPFGVNCPSPGKQRFDHWTWRTLHRQLSHSEPAIALVYWSTAQEL